MKLALGLIFFLGFSLLAGCRGQDPVHIPNPPPHLDKSKPPNFRRVTESVLRPYCYECHTGAEGKKNRLLANDYENVFSKLSEIRDSVEFEDMPPPKEKPPLPVEVKDYLLKWIELGGPL